MPISAETFCHRRRRATETRPTIDRIRSLCTSSSFERGMEYFREGRISQLQISGNEAIATVRGTRSYRVEIDLDGDFESSCTCPYDFGGYCKHTIATLIALSKEYDAIVSRSESETRRLDAALRGVDAEQLRDFLKKEFPRIKGLKEQFMIHATGELEVGGESIDDYKEDVSALYDDASEGGYVEYGNEIDFGPFLDLAEKYMERRNFEEAAKVCRALSEVIAENMDDVDDSDGYYGDRFWEALERLSSCVNSLAGEEKAGYIDYLFGKFLKGNQDYFQDAYDEALRLVCATREDLEHLRRLLEPHLPSSVPDEKRSWHKRYESFVFLDMQAFLLDGLANLGDEESRRGLYGLFRKYYLQNEDFCLLYAERLKKDGRLDEAIKVAKEGLRAFGEHLTTELRHFLDEHYEALPPEEYEENLATLFYQELDWMYYEKLKKVVGTRWNATLRGMIDHFSSRHTRYDDYDYAGGATLIEIYLKEKMFDAALKEVIGRRSVRTLGKYHRRLAERYPRDYFHAYKDLILPYADKSMGRDHYREVASHLKKMKEIKGFEEEFAEYLKMLRERFARRPAFLDEMKRL